MCSATHNKHSGRLPRLGANGCSSPGEWVVHLHFHGHSDHLYAVEHDAETDVYFGFVICDGDYDNAVWEYCAIEDHRDRHRRTARMASDPQWTPRKASCVEDITRAYQRQGNPW